MAPLILFHARRHGSKTFDIFFTAGVVDPGIDKELLSPAVDRYVIEEGNLVRGNWEPMIDEETWWKAQEIHKSRSNELANTKEGNMRSGVCASSDSYANKAYCECGYRLSPQYTHAATETEPAQFCYTCRQQINAHTANYRKMYGLPPLPNTCTLKSVTDVKMRLMSIKAFQYLFRDIKDTLEDTIKIIEQAERLNTEKGSSVSTLESLNETLKKLQRRLERYIDMRADGEISDLTAHSV